MATTVLIFPKVNIDALSKQENARLQQERITSEEEKEAARIAVKVAELETDQKESAVRLAMEVAERVDLDG